jgi:methionyl-tRNA formyltransferase
MATISVQAKLTTDDLLHALTQLEANEAEHLLRRWRQQLAQRNVPSVPQREAELLQFIAREKRAGFAERFAELQAKRRAFTLTPDEQDELIALSDEAEAFDVERLKALSELALLRQISVPKLMKQLGLKAPPVV